MSEDKNNEYVEANVDIRKNILDGTYTLHHKSGRSRIWKFFLSIINDRGEKISRKVCCTLCYTILSYNPKTTSNLLRHRCNHKKQMEGDTNLVCQTVSIAAKPKNEANERYLSKIKRIKSNKSLTCQYMRENAKIRYKILTGAFKLRKKVSRSKVWNIFSKIEDSEGNEIPQKVCCKTCYSVLNENPKCSSNLVKHRCYIKASLADPNEGKRTMSSLLKEIERGETILLKELEKSNLLIPSEEVTSNNEYTEQPYNELKEEAVNIFSQWCIVNFRPFELAKDAGLRRFTEFIISVATNYGTTIDIDNLLPDSSAIAQSIEGQFNVAFEKLRNEIEVDCQYGYGLTSKLWYDKCWQQKYMTLTIHYIKNGELISKLLGLGVVDIDDNIYDVLGIKIHEILSNYSFTYKDSIIVLDGNYNMTTALKHFNHINCINHLLNNVIEKAIQEVKELNELYSQCLKVKKYFTDFNANCELSSIFQSFCLAKWNATYYLLEVIDKNWFEIENFLQQNNESQKIKNIQKKHLEDVLRILKPFEHASKILEIEEYPTLHLVYAYVSGLKDSCLADEDNATDNIMQRFKEILIDQLQTTIISNFSITHKIALFLFPPANKLTQFSEVDKNLTKNKIISYLKPYVQKEIKKEIIQEPTISAASSTMISSYFKNFVTPPKSSNNCNEISSEILAYESLDIPYDDNFDILQWWHLRQTQFPLLYKLSCKILAAPASCASSERIFSVVRYLAKNNTCILSNPKIFNQLIFLNFNKDKNLDIKECMTVEKSIIENEAIDII